MRIRTSWFKTSFNRKLLNVRNFNKRWGGLRKGFMLYKHRVLVRVRKRRLLRWLRAVHLSNLLVWGCSRMYLNNAISSKLLSWKRKFYKSSSRHWLPNLTNPIKRSNSSIMIPNPRHWHKPSDAKLLMPCVTWKLSIRELRIIKKKLASSIQT